MTKNLAARRWSDLTGTQRAVVALAGLVQVSLQGIALRDLWRRDTEEVRGPKGLWAALSFVNYLGPLAYLRYGRRR